MNRPLNILTCIRRGYERVDEDLPTLSLYGWAMNHLESDPDDWDESKVHLSDYTYDLPPDDGGCDRQLFHRYRGDHGQDPTLWERLMWDQGFALQVRVTWLICQGMPDEWSLHGLEVDVSDGLPGDDVGSCDLVLQTDEQVLGVEFKTQRGRAFRYLQDEPKPSHALQAGAEGLALEEMHPDRPVRQRLVYVDREGQNKPLVFPVDPNPELRERIQWARTHAHDLHTRANTDGLGPPDPIDPQISVRQNKGRNSIYLEEPWMCSYCQYQGRSCPGALDPALSGNGIIAKGPHDGDFEVVQVTDRVQDVRDAITRAVESGNVSYR